MTPTLICPECSVEMRCSAAGVPVEGMGINGSYQIWMADRMACPSCNKMVLSIVSRQPLAHWFEPAYATIVASHSPRERFWANPLEKEKYARTVGDHAHE